MAKCYFQRDWLNIPSYTSWLKEVVSDRTMAYCSFCNSKFTLSNMGLRAVRSHEKGKKHQIRMKSTSTSSLKNMFSNAKNSGLCVVPPERNLNDSQTNASEEPVVPAVQQQCELLSSTSGMQKFLVKDEVSRAEIIWCLNSIMSHKSLRAAANDASYFANMFRNCEIAKNMQLGRDKMAYTIVYGLSPFFKDNLIKDLLACSHLVVGFDESLNKVSQKQQMDINVRYWCSKSNNVKTRYLNSAFLGRTRATDLLCAFESATKPLDLKKVLQISMDGPNVNAKFFKELASYIKESPEDPEILNMGSCGLHAVNVAFKKGVNSTDWNIMEYLRALYYLFKNSPARRSMYTQYTESDVFPRKFCYVRWLENSIAAERALNMLPHVKQFIDGVERDKVAPSSKSYSVVKAAVADQLLPAKLAFFKLISTEMESFLREYQNDKPLVPFLHRDLTNLTLKLIERFIKKEFIEKNIGDIDLKNNDIFLPFKKIDIGISTLCALKKAKVSENDIVYFRKDCRKFLLSCAEKLRERSPLSYELTNAVSCFDPHVSVLEKSFMKKLTKLLLILCDRNWISSTVADKSKNQLRDLCSQEHVILQLKSYKRTERLDEFWYKIMSSHSSSCEDALSILKIVMILSHGNSNIERGFSINSDCLWDNMKEESLVSRRTVYDSVSALGGLHNIEISKDMILSARNAHSRFKEAARMKRDLEKEKNAAAKRKRNAEFQIKELETKRNKILEDAHLQSEKINEEITCLKSC